MARHVGLYRRAHLIDRATVYGWHTFTETTPTDSTGEPWYRCDLCHTSLPLSALTEGFWTVWAGARCPDFLRPLATISSPSSPGPPRTTLF